MGFNVGARLKESIEAVRIALSQQPDVPFTDEELTTLRKFSGFGGIRAVIYGDGSREEWLAIGATGSDLALYDHFQELYTLLRSHLPEDSYQLAVRSLKECALTAFYTPTFIPDAIYKAFANQNVHPRYLYEPSAGIGVFSDSAISKLDSLERITVVEKDFVTGMILHCISSSYPTPTDVQIKGLEETDTSENGQYDLITSNIPFGSVSVYDPAFSEKKYSSRIHTYFFVKGLDKIADGGLLAFLTTDTFLNSPLNDAARRYLFERADFISVHGLPENLMEESAGTRVTTHLLIVQKRARKEALTADEELLIRSIKSENEYGAYPINAYLQQHPELYLGELSSGLNQYGEAQLSVLNNGPIEALEIPLTAAVTAAIQQRMNHQAFAGIRVSPNHREKQKLTFLPMPQRAATASNVQLGLFDTTKPEDATMAMDYIQEMDEEIVKRESAKMLGVIRIAENPAHEAIVFLTARHKRRNYYVYGIRSNVDPISYSVNWQNAKSFALELESIGQQLKSYGFRYVFEGDPQLAETFSFENISKQHFKKMRAYYREGTLVVHHEQVGLLTELSEERDGAFFEPISVRNKRAGFFPAYISLRNQYYSLSATPDDDHLRSQLRTSYENFVETYGQLNRKDNQELLLLDKGHGLLMLSSLERRENGRFVMSDVLSHQLQQTSKRPKTEDLLEALAYSLNDKGYPDLDYISEISEKNHDQVIGGLEGKLFLNPATDQWETADRYLSGNVLEKLNQAEEKAALEPDNSHYQNSLNAIRASQPERIPFDLLDFNFGERWIPNELYRSYISQLFETDTQVHYLESSDSFKVHYAKSNTKTEKEFAIVPRSGYTMYGHSLMEHALENTSPVFTYEVIQGGSPVRKRDNDAIQMAHDKIERIRAGFSDWLATQSEEVKKELETKYNRIYNSSRLRSYDGSHQRFPGLDFKGLGIPDLYSSQKDGVWRIIQERGGLIDHEVGLGKTMIMVVGAHEMKRLGLCQKPLLLTLNTNMQEIADTYRLGYPNDRVLIPSDNDFTPKNRQRLFHEMKNNEWDAVIITHDQFLKIQPSPAIQLQILSEELANVEADLEVLRDAGGKISKKALKGLGIRKINLTNSLKAAQQTMDGRRDRDVDFESIGFDHLFVDEFHKFKNLMFSTRHSRVSGLGNMEGSQKALNMLYAFRYLQDKFQSDNCATVLTGTPISNSLTELYLIFKYLRPRELARQHIENFDSWAAVFAKKTTDFEFTVTGEIVAKERFRHFIKVPELALAYNEIADYKTAAHIKLDRPKLEQHLVSLVPSPQQEAYIQTLIDFARTGNGDLIGRGRLSEAEDKGRMLIATHLAKNMAVDMRLLPTGGSDHPGNKVNTCARKAFEIYQNSNDHKGVQLIFCDVGTPGTQGFCLYDAMKQALTKLGVPEAEITYIHQWKRAQRSQLYKLLNNGSIRFLVGSTDKAGTGLNVQKRVVAIHHLDVPWRPIDLQQRDGRGARPGNLVIRDHYNNILPSYIYATEKSLDGYKFNLLRIKQLFTTQLKNNELHVRRIDEGGFDEQAGMNFSEYVAILSGDTSLLEKSKLERKVANLENLRAAHYRETTRYRWDKERVEQELKKNQAVLAQLTEDRDVYQKNLLLDKKGVKINAVNVEAAGRLGIMELAGHLLRLHRSFSPDTDPNPKKIGNLYGFELFIQQKEETYSKNGKLKLNVYNYFYAQRPGSEIKYTSMDGQPSKENLSGTARIFLNGIDRVVGLTTSYAAEGKQLTQQIEQLHALSIKPFERDAELKDLKTELDSLSRKIQLALKSDATDHENTVENTDLTPQIADVDLGGINMQEVVGEKVERSRRKMAV